MKFPAKGSAHQGRWCSGCLKAAVQDGVTSNMEQTKKDVKILVVSGERRGESKEDPNIMKWRYIEQMHRQELTE